MNATHIVQGSLGGVYDTIHMSVREYGKILTKTETS